MCALPTAEAFSLFRQLAADAGQIVHSEPESEAVATRADYFRRGGGEVRLEFDRNNERLTLFISHGPSSDEIVGWLDLYSASCKDGIVLDNGDKETRLLPSIEYALELMSTSGRTNRGA